MRYRLEFRKSAWAEWEDLDGSVRAQFKKVLLRRLEMPRVPSALLHGMPNCYKIKLRTSGYRLVYQVADDVVTVTVVAVGKRDKGLVYQQAAQRVDGETD
ncbi:MAG: mRNA interferase RelE/StbE [Pseudomonadota bacterium]|nr:mRNA interferase RelE/StbE [Pseudomonadota bacterium]